MVWSADQDDATGSALSSLVGNTPEFKGSRLDMFRPRLELC